MRGSTKTLFLSEGKCSCTSTPKAFGVAESKARQHRWAPELGYVTVIVHREEDLEPAMDLIRMSHRYFADKQNLSRMQHQ